MKKLLLILSIINIVSLNSMAEPTAMPETRPPKIFGYTIEQIMPYLEKGGAFAVKVGGEVIEGAQKAMYSQVDREIDNCNTEINQKKYKINKIKLNTSLNDIDKKNKIEKIKKSIEKLEERKQKAEKRKLKIAEDLRAKVLDTSSKLFDEGLKAAREEQEAGHRYREKVGETAIKAQKIKEATIESVRQILDTLKDPKNVAFFSVSLFGSIYGVKLLVHILEQYINKIPTIAEETSLVSYKQKLIDYLKKDKPESNVNDVVLEKDISDRIALLAHSLKNTVKNNGYFRHMLFYGPPGTGKTMLAKRLARSSGLEYIYFAGGSALDQLPIEEALSKLTELFEFAKNSKKKLMIIIDESEVLLADRSKKLSDKSRKLLNLLLGYTGTENNNFIIVALTNRPEDLDKAFLNRCDEHINISVPGLNERKAILKYYIEKLLISRTKEPEKRSFVSKLLGAGDPPQALVIEKSLFTQDYIEYIAKKLDNFVGRDILKLVVAIQSQAYASENCVITRELINKVVNQKIAQKSVENNF